MYAANMIWVVLFAGLSLIIGAGAYFEFWHRRPPADGGEPPAATSNGRYTFTAAAVFLILVGLLWLLQRIA